ncbi:hypothetical protein IOC61_03300 [Halomonas sp. KAO]|uniref:sulfotransferase family 2 domain-containing protein n=1 Tax=Halomonas sp. KAO TaxID=2783858 RepID=UPI00189CD8A9|nr:sulfotransferase family 2 domain-containing protein [Halomonas sp. KAO]MBF7052342.1 hypothetical protein [Halomonas sp. KAO]
MHIPKTAGTSFRLGAERCFGKEQIVYDYGKDSPATTPLTVDTLYAEPKDFWSFKSLCERKRASMVGGHVNANRFVSLFGVDQTLTFLREPLQRMASEYAHFVRHYEYKGSFHDFYSRTIMHNRQSKILHGVDVEAIGFVGLTERYAESLEVLNARYAIDIPQREDNIGRKRLEAKHEISAEDVAEFKRLNRRDIRLYDQVTELFDQRFRLFQEGKSWAHARLVEVKPQGIAGWAWWAGEHDEPVAVEVWVNGKHLETIAAVELRPGLCRLLPPRGGYVGFHLPVKLKPSDKVQCRIASTGQWFPLKPSRVPKPEA